ncbi:MAG: DUF1080 domain-containing protein [Bacteroidia bacterium]|nr:DUF1080 domain-containing protein [Bacteroidia bacterium]
MKKVCLLMGVLVLILLSVSCNQKKSSEAAEEWVQLFNGKDLANWTVKIKGYDVGDNFGNTFRVEDGIIKVRYDQYDSLRTRFGHLFYKDEFSHYKLRVEYRIVGEQCPGAPGWAYKNSGIMIHGQTAQTMEKDQDFPTSIEVQLLASDSLIQRTNMNVCTPGTNIVVNNELILDHCVNSSSENFYGENWITAEVEVRGSKVIHHIINGDTVLTYNQPQLDERDASYAKLVELNDGNIMLSKGTISLQSEGHPIDFRKVEILVLED